MITLRNFHKNDTAHLQHINGYSDLSTEQIENLIASWNQKQYNDRFFEMFAIVSGDKIVGTISLYQQSTEVISIGPEIFDEYRRNGYAKTAMIRACQIAKEKGYKIVSQQIRVDNTASIALHTSIGFETNGLIYTNAKGNQVSIYLKCLL
ncbi:MAG: GNAT family N-acetyltransferase [Eubacteriales bacterium]